jgi:hypothetical protein
LVVACRPLYRCCPCLMASSNPTSDYEENFSRAFQKCQCSSNLTAMASAIAVTLGLTAFAQDSPRHRRPEGRFPARICHDPSSSFGDSRTQDTANALMGSNIVSGHLVDIPGLSDAEHGISRQRCSPVVLASVAHSAAESPALSFWRRRVRRGLRPEPVSVGDQSRVRQATP